MPTTTTTWNNDIAPSSVAFVGELTDGSTAGDSAAAASSVPYFEDDFSSGNTSSPTGAGIWGVPGEGGGVDDVSVTTVNPYPGDTYSLQFTYTGNTNLCDDAWAEQPFTLTEGQEEVWVEYYLYIPDGTEGFGSVKYKHRLPVCPPSDPSGIGNNNKFFFLWGENYSSNDVKAFFETRSTDGTDARLYPLWGTDTSVSKAYPTGWNPAITDAVRGKWNQIRVNARVATSKAAADGYLHLWWDGTLRCTTTDIPLATTDGTNTHFRKGYLCGWSNSGFTDTTRVWIARFKIYNSDPGW